MAVFVLCLLSVGEILSLHLRSDDTLVLATGLVVVLGGGGPERFATGLQLIQSGSANKLLLINRLTSEIKTAKEAAGPDQFTLSTDVLSRNSLEEAVRTRAWMSEHGVTRVTVVSDPPHMLRLAYTWSRVFAGTSLSYSLVATQPAWWSAWRWWANPESRRFVGSEVLKLAYYVWHY